jgi:hypothetical protein
MDNGDYVTYGDSITVPKEGWLSKEDVKGAIEQSDTNGHNIAIDGTNSFECEHCDETKSVPDLIEQSAGFRQVLYKLYIIGQFSDTDCDSVAMYANSSKQFYEQVLFNNGWKFSHPAGEKFEYVGANEWASSHSKSLAETRDIYCAEMEKAIEMQYGKYKAKKFREHIDSRGGSVSTKPSFNGYTYTDDKIGLDKSGDADAGNTETNDSKQSSKSIRQLCKKVVGIVRRD